MSTISIAATPEAKKDPQARKHLQRVLRKVRHVLIVKRCIDDLKNGASRMRGGGQTQNILDKIPSGPEILPDLSNASRGTIDAIKSTLAETTSAILPDAARSDSILKQLPEGPGASGNLISLESGLDRYISVAWDAVRKFKRVIDSSQDFLTGWSRDPSVLKSFWINWAKKRVFSVRDNRALALIDVLDEVDEGLGQLQVVQEYLDAYRKGSYDRAPESLSDVTRRLRTVFGVGWFFEWPSGQHPLNSTWPWADVKPSLMVLWGVCWMFFAAPYGQPHRPGHPFGPAQPYPYNNYCDDLYGYSGRPIPRPSNNLLNQRFVMSNMRYDGTTAWMPDITTASLGNGLPGSHRPRASRLEYARGAQDVIGSQYGPSPAALALNTNSNSNSSQSERFMLDSVYANNARDEAGWSKPQLTLSTQHTAPPSSSLISSNHVSHPFLSRRTVAQHPVQPLWRNSSDRDRLTQSTAPDHLGENHLNQAAILRTFNSPTPIRDRPFALLEHPPSMSAPMPSSSFSNYPPLDQIPDLHNSQPYMVGQERAYQDMPEYDQHQDQPRYPTPPPPLSDPYNNQQGIDPTADGRLDMPMEQKSDSDAQSPGRSKPVPKPDREVTKDANGRFYCNWQGCTEDAKDFGRKCEWSKHMDKHDRPYKCPADGCEKLPGFTYSGGLLRHEREVHNKHGGPRKQLNCPHPNCKRHTGKGFSRQENLNEHLRRVHTDAGLPLHAEDTDDEANEQLGVKRKRGRADSADLREEMKRLKAENEELKRQAEAQTAQSAEMMRQIMQLQQTQQIMQHPRMQAPPAQMT